MSNFLATMPRRMHCPQLERFTESEKLPSVEVTLGPVRFSLLLGVASVCLPASMAANIGFHPRIDLSTGSSKPVRIAIADFNGDGKLDIAAPDYYGQDLLIYLNKGDGTFGAPIVNTLQISNTLDGLVASDLDKDGKQDLVVGTVSGAQQDDIVWLGNGDDTFRQQPRFRVPSAFRRQAGRFRWERQSRLHHCGECSPLFLCGSWRWQLRGTTNSLFVERLLF